MLRLFAIAATLVSTLTFAQTEPAARPDGPPPKWDIAKFLNLDAARAAKVDAIMDSGRQQGEALRAQMKAAADPDARQAVMKQMQALMAETRQQLAAVLTADELAKLDAERPHPPRRAPPA